MTKTKATIDEDIEDFVELYLENGSFEELLEEFDLSPVEVFIYLFKSGLIDSELLEGYF